MKRRIENKPSSTAAWTCTSRAISFMESNPMYKSNDFIAPKLLPKFLQAFFKTEMFREFFKRRFIPSGMYEYLIARTKYIDAVFESVAENGIEQILIFGAGYDSRGIRLYNQEKGFRVFELDAPETQKAKIGQLKKRGISINRNMVFISIDFNKESLRDKLIESGFDRNKKSLFVLEGLTMYLEREAVDSTFKIIDEFSASGSEIVFDYIYLSVLKRHNALYGEKEIYATVKNANEEWCFGIEKGELKLFLEAYHFSVVEDLSPEDLQNKYFSDDRRGVIGKINGTHCIAYAIKKKSNI